MFFKELDKNSIDHDLHFSSLLEGFSLSSFEDDVLNSVIRDAKKMVLI